MKTPTLTNRMKTSLLPGAMLLLLSPLTLAQNTTLNTEPLVVARQGSFSVGGTVTVNGQGLKRHADHGYVFFQQPLNPNPLPVIFLHGIYQSTSTWESTPDGREGFQSMFLRAGYTTYNMTHPRRGNAGRAAAAGEIPMIYDEESWFTKWRIGRFPAYFENVQFPRDAESLNQFFRQITPDTAPLDFEVNAAAIAALFEKTGDAVLVAHSQGVMHAWKTIPQAPHIKAMVGLEGGGFFSFPAETDLSDIKVEEGIEYIRVSDTVFQSFTRLPILLIYGDNIPTTPCNVPELDIWRIRLELARRWTDVVNRHGGHVTLLHLPSLGIIGNTHFMMQDLNNRQIAQIIFEWLEKADIGIDPTAQNVMR